MRYATSRRPDALRTRPLVLATCCVATYNALESAAQRAKITLTAGPTLASSARASFAQPPRVGLPRVAPPSDRTAGRRERAESQPRPQAYRSRLQPALS